jgi:hypothetical protein
MPEPVTPPFRYPSLLAALAGALLIAGAPAAALAAAAGPVAGTASKRVGKTTHKRRVAHRHRATGPSLSVIGFGVDRLFVAAGTKVTSKSKCAQIVGAATAQQPGPAQTIYLVAYVRATHIPAETAVEIQDALPEPESSLDEAALTPRGTWTPAFVAGSLTAGGPSAKTKHVFRTLIEATAEESGATQGPTAAEFNGTYSYTASAQVGTHTLKSTARVVISCP